MWTRASDKAIQSIQEATSRINIWEGAVRSSKTITSLAAWLVFIRDAPPGPLMMIGKTERTLSRNILDVIQDIVGTENFNYNRGLGECKIFNRKVLIAGANDERAEQKIRGLTLAGAYGDEVTLWPESFFRMLLSRLSVKGARLYATTNPDSPYHWLKEDILDNPKLNLSSWHFTLDDNPALDPEYVSDLKNEYTGIWYKRFILGQWVLAEGVIYDMWDDSVHVIEPPHVMDFYDVAIDYGTATVMTFGLFGNRAGNYYLCDEYYYDARKVGKQKTDSEFANDFEAFVGDKKVNVYIDPSAKSFTQELRRRGYTVIEADNSVIDGIRYVSRLFSDRRFFVAPECKHFQKEITQYVWDEKAQNKGEDKPMKSSDHLMDATRYYLYTRYGKDKRARSHSTQDTTDPIYRRGDLTLIGKKYIDKS